MKCEMRLCQRDGKCHFPENCGPNGFILDYRHNALMVESVDTRDLKSLSRKANEGSSPSRGTNHLTWQTPYTLVPHWSWYGRLLGLYSIKFEETYVLNVNPDQAGKILHCLNAAYNLGYSSGTLAITTKE